ncbi:MAG: EVE domain-containing protein [Myxococcaceae bacterium]
MAAKKHTPNYWLIKSEPTTYSWANLEKDRKTSWTGIRNFEARNNLRKMLPGDLALYYHTGDEKAVVGVARVCSHPKPDKTGKPGEEWTTVDVEPLIAFDLPVSLSKVKETADLSEMGIVKKGRISVVPVTPAEFKKICQLAKTKVPN